MTNIDYFLRIILPLEGGEVNDPDDAGGHTKYGVTFNTVKRLSYDTNKDGVINNLDVSKLTHDDVARILVMGKFYKSDYNNLNPELAFHLTDRSWASGKIWPYQIYLKLNKGFSDKIILSFLLIIESIFYRYILRLRNNKKYKAGWFKKLLQSSIRNSIGVNLDPQAILTHLHYDKNNSTSQLLI